MSERKTYEEFTFDEFGLLTITNGELAKKVHKHKMTDNLATFLAAERVEPIRKHKDSAGWDQNTGILTIHDPALRRAIYDFLDRSYPLRISFNGAIKDLHQPDPDPVIPPPANTICNCDFHP